MVDKRDRIAFIIPYFGKFPNYFQLFLNSAGHNDDCVDFYIFTDDKTNYKYPSNCKVVCCSFESLKDRFRELFDFNIALNTPYKICDYRPTYGDAFKEELKGYKYWGHCDIDLIFGNISKFVFENDDISKYDRFLGQGHFSIYKNSKLINEAYKKLQTNHHMNYMDVYKTDNLMAFDEYAAHNGGGSNYNNERKRAQRI